MVSRRGVQRGFDKILQTDANPKRRTEFLGLRWQSAAKMQRWKVIVEDQKLWRPEFQFLDEEGWVELLLQVVHSSVWYDQPAAQELSQLARKDFESHGHLSLRHPDWFDRCESLDRFLKSWKKLARKKSIPAPITEIFRLNWNQSLEDFVPEFRLLLEAVHSDPLDWLKILDEVQKIAPLLMNELGKLLESYQDRLGVSPTHPGNNPELIQWVDESIARLARSRYAELRVKLLEFCTREWIHPEWLQEWFPERTVFSQENKSNADLLAKQLERDLPLRYVCWAERLFWNS